MISHITVGMQQKLLDLRMFLHRLGRFIVMWDVQPVISKVILHITRDSNVYGQVARYTDCIYSVIHGSLRSNSRHAYSESVLRDYTFTLYNIVF